MYPYGTLSRFTAAVAAGVAVELQALQHKYQQQRQLVVALCCDHAQQTLSLPTVALSVAGCHAAVLLGDIGKAARGEIGRTLVYCVIYSLDATRCIILQLAATQSLHHALGAAAPAMWQCGLVVVLLAGLLSQVSNMHAGVLPFSNVLVPSYEYCIWPMQHAAHVADGMVLARLLSQVSSALAGSIVLVLALQLAVVL
jgi:hypothetical protein